MSNPGPTPQAVAPLMAAALIHLSRGLAGAMTALLGVVAVWQRDAHWLAAAGLCFLVWASFALLHAFEAARTRCSRCTGSLFGASPAAEKRRPRGGRGPVASRMAMALQILGRAAYRCRHCGETTHADSGPEAGPRFLPPGSPVPKRPAYLFEVRLREPSKKR